MVLRMRNRRYQRTARFAFPLTTATGQIEASKRAAQDAQDTLLKNKEQMLLLQEENLRLTRENSLFADEVEQKVQVPEQ